MATTLTPQLVARTGLTPIYAAPDVTGNNWVNNGTQYLHVKNANAGACTITFPVPVLVDGQAVASRTVVVPATTGDKMIGPFAASQYNDAFGSVNCTWSLVASVTCALLQITPVT